jgi:putative redox protein
MTKTIVLTRLDGFKFSAVCGGHQLILDLKEEQGGTNQGMSPGELLCASLGACTAMTIIRYCQTAHIPIDTGIKVEATYVSDNKDSKVEKFEIKIFLPVTSERMERAMNRAASLCYVKNTLKNPPDIVVEIVNSYTP